MILAGKKVVVVGGSSGTAPNAVAVLRALVFGKIAGERLSNSSRKSTREKTSRETQNGF